MQKASKKLMFPPTAAPAAIFFRPVFSQGNVSDSPVLQFIAALTCGFFALSDHKQKRWRSRGLNPRPLRCKLSALPLSYTPCVTVIIDGKKIVITYICFFSPTCGHAMSRPEPGCLRSTPIGQHLGSTLARTHHDRRREPIISEMACKLSALPLPVTPVRMTPSVSNDRKYLH